MVHGPNVAPGVDIDGLTGLDLYYNNGLCFQADVVGADGPEGVHHVCAAVQVQEPFLHISDGEFELLLDFVCRGQV